MSIEKNYSCFSSMDHLKFVGKHTKKRSRTTAPFNFPFLLKPLIRSLFYYSLDFTIKICFSIQIKFSLRFTISVQSTGHTSAHYILSIMLAAVVAQSISMFASHAEGTMFESQPRHTFVVKTSCDASTAKSLATEVCVTGLWR